MKKRRKKYPKVPSALHEPRRTKNGLEQLNLVLHSHSPTHPLPPRPRTISFIARCTQPSAHSVFWHHREKLFTASALNWATCHPTSRVRQLHMFPTTKQVYTMTSKGTPPLYPSPPPFTSHLSWERVWECRSKGHVPRKGNPGGHVSVKLHF